MTTRVEWGVLVTYPDLTSEIHERTSERSAQITAKWEFPNRFTAEVVRRTVTVSEWEVVE